MALADCKRCRGTGKTTDRHPSTDRSGWCLGCNGDGKVDVPDPSAMCARCNGRARSSDAHPQLPRVRDWCLACSGTGYAK